VGSVSVDFPLSFALEYTAERDESGQWKVREWQWGKKDKRRVKEKINKD
jgi:hypothetical protein